MKSESEVNKNTNRNELSRSRTWTNSEKNLRIAVIGAANVGKTAIVNQLLHQQFVEEYSQTKLDIHYKNMNDLDIDILDSGHLETPDLRKIAIKNAHAFILVFALDDMSSFNFVMDVRNEIIDMKGYSTPYIVVGNKADIDSNRCVPFPLADCLVSVEWETIYSEISAKETNDVNTAFNTLFRLPSIQQKVRLMRSMEELRNEALNENSESDINVEVIRGHTEKKVNKSIWKIRKYLCL